MYVTAREYQEEVMANSQYSDPSAQKRASRSLLEHVQELGACPYYKPTEYDTNLNCSIAARARRDQAIDLLGLILRDLTAIADGLSCDLEMVMQADYDNLQWEDTVDKLVGALSCEPY